MLEINRKKLGSLMESFYVLTNMRIVLYDNEYNEIMSWPGGHCDFCKTMRQSREFYQNCRVSDSEAFRKCAKLNEPYVYTCHAGLVESVIQIRNSSSAMGYIMFGQVVLADNSHKARVHLAKRYISNDKTDLLDIVFSMPEKTALEIHSAAKILGALSAYLWTDHVVELAKQDFIDMLNDYIDEHLQEQITAADLCKSFKFGKTHLYKLAATYLNRSIAGYVRSRRIWHAKKLLVSEYMPVSEISGAVGFADYNYFSKCFKAEIGMTAGQYRRNSAV